MVLDAFMYTIKNNDYPTLLDCNNLLMNPKIIYGYINILHKPKSKNDYNTRHDYIYNYQIYDSNIDDSIEYIMSFNIVKDFIRRYFEYNQKIASIGTNYRSVIDNKEHIRKELNLFNNCCNKLNKEHNYLYFYIIKINNELCLKIGVSTHDLFQTFVRQILIEQYTQDIESFRLLAIYDYSSLTIAENTEHIIKEALHIFSIDKQQRGLYSFYKSWSLIQSYIINGMMFSKSYIRENIEDYIKKMKLNV
jgi:hypothetical protein